ncbi:MAG: hypothetical protein WCO68_02680 [Verrucomicrobiota bacterium]
MKKFIYTILLVIAFTGSVLAGEFKKVPIKELDALTLQAEGLLVNNINFVIEGALFGGVKATVQCTVKNKTEFDLNYTVYLAAFDKGGTLLACFSLEPTLNTHEAGKVETLTVSGMVDSASKGKADYVLVKVVAQKAGD